jgi:hypothetical protein
MAEYILSILRTQLMIVFSWGFSNAQRLPNDAGLRFRVNGFKYQGIVEVIYNEGLDLFEVKLIQTGRIVDNVYLDNLVEVIDSMVEKTDNYEEDVKKWSNIK